LPTVKFYATLRKVTGAREVEFDAGSVSELIDALSREYGEKIDRYLKVSTVTVNGTNASELKGERTRLKPKDVVSIFPPLGGG